MPGWMKSGDRAYRATVQEPAGEYYRLSVEGTPGGEARWEWVAWTSNWCCQGSSQSAIDAMKAAEQAIQGARAVPARRGVRQRVAGSRGARPH